MRTFFVAPSLTLSVVVSLAASALAQMPTYTKAGPLPPALATATSVFVSNAGSDSDLFPEPFLDDPDRPYPYLYSGDPDRAYTEFFAALKATGDFTLVADPARADLVLELRLTAPRPDSLPTFRLDIYDGKTHYVLWTITHAIRFAYLQKTHDKNFDAALTGVLNQFLQISGKTPAPAH
jgi:hypothetical protein